MVEPLGPALSITMRPSPVTAGSTRLAKAAPGYGHRVSTWCMTGTLRPASVSIHGQPLRFASGRFAGPGNTWRRYLPSRSYAQIVVVMRWAYSPPPPTTYSVPSGPHTIPRTPPGFWPVHP